MKKTVKRVSLILAAILLLSMLSACGGGGSSGGSDTPESPKPTETVKPTESPNPVETTAAPSVPGKLVDAGDIQTLVPEGWAAYPAVNFMTDEVKTNVIRICKGAETELDTMSKPLVTITYRSPDDETSLKELKEGLSDTKDVKIQCGSYSWEGFTTAEYGDLAAMLLTNANGKQYEAQIYLEAGGESISLDDADVQAILANVGPSDGTGISIADADAQSGGAAAPESPKPTEAPKPVQTMDVPEIPGVLVDAGHVQALEPEGWKAFPRTDFFTDEVDPNVLLIVKDGETDMDTMSKPMVSVVYFPPEDEFEPEGAKEYYGDAADVQPMKCGANSYQGFTTSEMGDPTAILWTETNGNRYEVQVFLEVNGTSVALDDPDVLAILASIGPSDGTGLSITEAGAQSVGADAEAGAYEWWDGSWYGWWAIYNGSGAYEDASNKNMCWDIYARIEARADGSGSIVLWDTGTTESRPLISCDSLTFVPGDFEHGKMLAENVVFFPAGEWNKGWEADPATDFFGWIVNPAYATVSRFDQMIEITGSYESLENEQDSFSYSVFLKPWGETWDDVKTGDTEGCLYRDMMPLYYDKWYLPLLELGYEQPPATYDEGIEIVEAGIPAGESGGSLVGQWEYEGGGYTYTFNEDGTGSYDYGGESDMTFTYEDLGTSVSILFDGNTDPSEQEYSIKGNRLIMIDILGDETIFIAK